MNLNNLFESDFNKQFQQGVVEGGPYDLPGIDYDRPGDTPTKRRGAPSDYPYSQEQDDAYFNDIFRKKREAAKKAEQDKAQGVAEGQEVDVNVVVEKLQQIAAHAKQQIQNADYDQQKRYATTVRNRALAALDMINQGGNTPEAAHAAFRYMQTGKQGATEGLNEFSFDGNDDGQPKDDPYKYPKPEQYRRSIDFFGKFEANHFDKEDMDDATGVFKGYWYYGNKLKQIAYFKFNNPQRTGSNDPGMGWYYEPQDEGVVEGSLTEFAEKPENGPGSDEYEDLLFHLAWEIWSEAGDSAQAERKLSLLGWKPEFGDDYTAMVLYKIGSNDHRQYTIDEFEEYGGSGDEDLDESRMAELDAEYEDYKRLSPREFYNMYKTTKQQWLAKYKSMLPQQGVAEADKKKDELEPEVRDVALQRAISRAKADFPTAGTGIEALAKDFMRSQDQDQKSFDQIRQAERQQNQMLAQINQIDQEQAQELQGLEKQNSSLSNRLQQLQSVNSQLEKKLAAMSGRKEKRKTDKLEPASSANSSTSPTTINPVAQPEPDTTPEPTTSKAIGQVAKTLAPPAPSAAIDQMAQQLQPRQKELGFDEPNVLEPNVKSGRRINTSKAVDAPYRDVSVKMAKKLATDPAMRNQMYNSDALRNLAGQEEMPLENKEQKPERPEADYGDEYQDMVKRVKHLAGQGPRKTVWDPVKRVYKTVPVNK